ncbi:MAG: S41 family peptidase [Thermoanaerobaculales bacterium]
MNRIVSAVLLGVLIAAVGNVEAQINARLLRQPDVSSTHITFVYAGDIWVMPKEGGVAQRLSTPKGEESFPRFSPDGSLIGFTGNYDGNLDIYVVPTAGGLPTRITHHPGPDRMLDWYPDGAEILYATPMTSEKQRYRKLYKVSAEGGLPEKLPVPYGEFGAISPDGTTLAYMPLSRDFRTWKRYRGGTAPEIWLFGLSDHHARNLTANDANDGQPMWHGSTLYFLSDRDQNKRANIWAYDLKTDFVRQVTEFSDFDIHFPAIGPEDMVFENAGKLYLMDLITEELRPVEVQVLTDKATLRPHPVKVAERISSGDISPSGKRAVLGARGEIFTLPAEHGVIRNLTLSSGVAERHPSWSPDGKLIAYFSDRSGEYELTVRPSDGSGEETVLTSLGPGYRYEPQWSPDSKKLVFIDSFKVIRFYDFDTDSLTEVDEVLWMTHGALTGFEVSWSTDSRWFVYARGLDNLQNAIFLYDTTDGSRHQLTSGFVECYSPVFDPEGKYLYYLSDNSFSPIYGELDPTWIYTNTTTVVAVPLRDDVPSPLAPRNDVEEAEEEDEKSAENNGDMENGEQFEKDEDNGDDKQEKEKTEPVEIDIEGFEARAVVLPPKAGQYDGLGAVKGKVIYQRQPRTGADDDDSSIVYWDLSEREEKTIIDAADGYAIAADGKKMLVVKGKSFAIVDVGPGQKMDKALNTSAMEMTVDPVAEWRQIFRDAWRLERDYFYDPGMHGVDWEAMRERYAALLDDAVTRWDVNFIIGELIGELNTSHSYRGGGDVERGARRGVGLLGVDWELAEGAYRIKKIVTAAPWDTEVRSPLAEAAVDVSEGDWVLAVNGVPIDPAADPWAAFEGLADTTVILTVNNRPSLDGAREVLVKTLSSENRLRNLAWIEANRKKVEQATDGRVGYIYVPSTGRDGQTELYRMFRAQYHLEGLIIDERFNNGGQNPDRFVELLNRPLVSYWAVRSGRDAQTPTIAHNGPQVMLINSWSGSGGDAFPYYFRAAGLGPLIGTRTWGGLIGYSGRPGLIDGGRVTVPTFSFYNLDGEWEVEGYGVDPDIEVVDDPSLMVDGGDPQLDRAIEVVLQELEEMPPVRPDRPEYPVR